MFRILTASKDTYITNKIIAGVRSTDSNVGQAASLDLFKLYDETYLSGTSNPTEISRALIKFDYNPLLSITNSLLSPSGSNFSAHLQLKNIFGGQTVPSNFILQVNPLAKDWDEGTGFDINYFKDLDSCNWVTASANPTVVTWSLSGAAFSGSLGATCDYYTSGNIGIGSQSLTVTQSFITGHEDLLLDITHFVSASIWGNLPNNGFRLSFLDSQETDQTTRFVKRFGGKNVNNPNLRPHIFIKYDGNVVSDDSTKAFFEETNKLFFYNYPRGVYQNLVSGSTIVSGANSVILQLVASRSVVISTSSWSQTHSQSITYNTRSMTYFSASFSGSQLVFGTLKQTGSYYSSVVLSPFATASLNTFLDTKNEQAFLMLWKSPDNTHLFSSGGYVTFKKYQGDGISFDQRNYVINITNLEQFYTKKENTRLRVFIQDWDFNFSTQRLPSQAISRIFKNMYWRLIDPYTKDIVVPFDTVGTKLSSDNHGMFFDFWFEDLDASRVYEFEFKIEENGRTDSFFEQGFRFKVVHE